MKMKHIPFEVGGLSSFKTNEVLEKLGNAQRFGSVVFQLPQRRSYVPYYPNLRWGLSPSIGMWGKSLILDLPYKCWAGVGGKQLLWLWLWPWAQIGARARPSAAFCPAPICLPFAASAPPFHLFLPAPHFTVRHSSAYPGLPPGHRVHGTSVPRLTSQQHQHCCMVSRGCTCCTLRGNSPSSTWWGSGEGAKTGEWEVKGRGCGEAGGLQGEEGNRARGGGNLPSYPPATAFPAVVVGELNLAQLSNN